MADLLAFLSSTTGLLLLGGYYALLVIGERAAYWAKNAAYDDADARCSVGLNLTNSLFNLILSLLLPLALYALVWDNWRLVDNPSLWLAIPLAFLWHDFAYYCEHRMGHRVGFFWAMHSIHHSSNAFNHSTAARGFLLDGVFNTPWHLPAALIGIPPPVYFGVVVLKNAYGIWNHASYVGWLGSLERWLATPLNHKIHHANQPEYIDRNYGQVLMLWDYLFGSVAHLGREPVPGLVNPVHDNNIITAQFTGVRWLAKRIASAARWQDKIAYLWRPPEWSHDGVCRSDCPKYAVAVAA